MSFKGWLNSWGLSWGGSDAPAGYTTGSATVNLSTTAHLTGAGWVQGSTSVSFTGTGELSDGVAVPAYVSGTASIAFNATGVITDKPAEQPETSGGSAYRRFADWIGLSRAPAMPANLPAQPQALAMTPTATVQPVDSAQNSPLADIEQRRGATEFVAKLLANLPDLPPDSTPPASDASAPRGVISNPKETHVAQALEAIQTAQEGRESTALDVASSAAAVRAAREDEELALIVILLEAA